MAAGRWWHWCVSRACSPLPHFHLTAPVQAKLCLSRKGCCGGGSDFSQCALQSSLECHSSFSCSCLSSGPSEGPAQLCHGEGLLLSQCRHQELLQRRERKSSPCCSSAESHFPSSRICVPLYFVCLAKHKYSDLRSSR